MPQHRPQSRMQPKDYRVMLELGRRLQTMLLLLTIALPIAVTSVIGSLDDFKQHSNNHPNRQRNEEQQQQKLNQQQAMISSMAPTQANSRQQSDFNSSNVINQGPIPAQVELVAKLGITATNIEGNTNDTIDTLVSKQTDVTTAATNSKRAESRLSQQILDELRAEPNRPLDSIITRAEDSIDLDINSIVARSQAHSVKSRRHAAIFNPPVADWWTKLAAKSSTQPPMRKSAEAAETRWPHRSPPVDVSSEASNQRRTESNKHSSSTNGSSKGAASGSSFDDQVTSKHRSVYKEQPLNQNAILTIKNQLSAIKGKHKMLVTSSMQQLQHLDNRLIESYRLCLKRKMPLYAGMLYRTRDFVSRMAKEAIHERKVLEAMTRQVHNVLRQKMTNRTLVREYSKLVQLGPAASTGDVKTSSQHQPSIAQHSVNLRDPQADMQSVKSYSQDANETESLNNGLFDSTQRKADIHPSNQVSKGDPTVADNELNSTPMERRGKATIWFSGTKTLPKEEKQFQKVTSRSDAADTRETITHDTDQELERVVPKVKQSKYTVSVNEVNLRRELTKIQSLIDRINSSTYEISSVVDDIIHLFRLGNSNEDFPSRRGKPDNKFLLSHYMDGRTGSTNMYSASTDPKQVMKTLRSPIKVFLEKYGKLANLRSTSNEFNGTSINSDFTTMNSMDIKPLFEPSSLVYSELKDPDIGFD